MATLARMGNLEEGDVPGCIARGKNYSGLKAVTSPGFAGKWRYEVMEPRRRVMYAQFSFSFQNLREH